MIHFASPGPATNNRNGSFAYTNPVIVIGDPSTISPLLQIFHMSFDTSSPRPFRKLSYICDFALFFIPALHSAAPCVSIRLCSHLHINFPIRLPYGVFLRFFLPFLPHRALLYSCRASFNITDELALIFQFYRPSFFPIINISIKFASRIYIIDDSEYILAC